MDLARRQDGAESRARMAAASDAFALIGPAGAAALALGVLATMRLAHLPPLWGAVSLGILGVALCWHRFAPAWRLLGVVLIGLGWASVNGQQALDLRLPPALVGSDLAVEGRVVGLPETRTGLQRFDLRIEAGQGAAEALVGRRVRLSWYGRADALRPGERWTLTLRLRRPRGVLNPGGFDFERQALEHRIAATGYVREEPGNRQLAGAGGLDAWRAALSARLQQQTSPGLRFVRALALGDTRGFDERDWEILRVSGLGHLFAISGFHIGIVAGFAGLLAALAYRLRPRWGLWLPRQQGAALAALVAALGYAAAAGFSLPTRRAVLMIGVVLLARLLRRAHAPTQAFALALIVLLLADPLAVLGAGFWLSFLGVGWLLWCLPAGGREGGYLRPLLTAQAVVTLGLLPLTVWFFGQASLIGPLLNLVAIPVVTLLVVPLSLLGVALEAMAAGLGEWPLWAAATLMDTGWAGVEWLAGWDRARLWLPEPDLVAMLLAVVGVAWLLMPRGTPARMLGVLLCLPLVWPASSRPGPGAFDLAVIDVGQGLAVLVRTAGHALVYDTGPAFEGGLDLGEAAVVPALHAQGIGGIDALVVSHGDNDHAGGRHAVLRGFAPALRLAPAGWNGDGFRACEQGGGWEWDGVRFEFLHPPPHFPYLGNDASCVLRVSGRFGAALLPGDIGESIEARLLRESPERLRADVLLVPHHGSRTSSSEAFVAAVNPALAVFAVGHRNRFGLPREDVVARYRDAGAQREDSARAGFLRIRLDQDGARVIERRRQSQRRFWHETGD